MKKPVLIIMAAGMGSRYGGLKQIDPVDDKGHIIMDFSLYDAKKAGFEKVIFIIKKENEELFKEVVGKRAEQEMEVEYAFQELDDLPAGFAVPEERKKPWGTGHAVLSARHLADGPFCVINSDDYYGKEAFSLIYQFLTTHEDDDLYRYAMVGYVLNNTVTDSGYVARGVCELDERGSLVSLTERTRIIRTEDGCAYSEDGGSTWINLDPSSLVSMNMWGFTHSFMKELEERFPVFLEKGLVQNPAGCEYFLPFVADELLQEKKAGITVLRTEDKWYGVTYKEDKETVTKALEKMEQDGLYDGLA